MILGVLDSNDCDFGIKFEDADKLDLVKKLARDGLATWYQAAHIDEDEENEHFTKEEVEAFYGSDYAEPTSELLDRYGIEHEIINLEFNDDGECITECDEAIWY